MSTSYFHKIINDDDDDGDGDGDGDGEIEFIFRYKLFFVNIKLIIV